MNKTQQFVTVGIAACAMALGGCKGGRLGNMYSQSQEIKMGQDFAKEYEGDRKNRFVTSGPQYDQLQRVSSRIFPLARKDWNVPYSIKLVDSKEVNAFAVPGGPIYFYKGLMDLASSDDEVAAVLGHEATHIVKRHSAAQMSDSQGKSILAEIFLGVTKANRDQRAAVGAAKTIFSDLPFSRSDESQADEYGFKYLTQAGYNPDAMATFFEKMGKKTGGGAPEILASHPVTAKRVAAARKRADNYKKGIAQAP